MDYYNCIFAPASVAIIGSVGVVGVVGADKIKYFGSGAIPEHLKFVWAVCRSPGESISVSESRLDRRKISVIIETVC